MHHPLDFNAILERYPDLPPTIVAAYERSQARHGPQDGVVEGEGRASYQSLWEQSDTVARALAANGISKGDHVGICVGNGVEWAVLFLGILRAGAVCVPINTRLKPDEIRYQLRQADVRLLFCVDRLLSIDFTAVLRTVCPEVDSALPSDQLPLLRQVVMLGAEAPAGCVALSDFLATGGDAPLPEAPGAQDDALIQFTSGTTSLPKGVLLTHRNIVTDAYFVGRRMGVRSSDKYLSARPFFHVAGSSLSLVVAAVYGATLITMQRFVPEEALRLLAHERCGLTSGNDTMYLMMLNSPDFAKHDYALRGGWAAASPSIMRRVAKEFGATETVVAYGLSEAAPNIAMSDHRAPLDDRIEGWITPHPGLELRIVNPQTGFEQPTGQPGEIRVRGWNVMRGYYNKPKETAEAFDQAGFLKTGDLGMLRADGALRFIGRHKEIIRVGGENVAPTEIEDLLHTHPKVRQAVVCGVPDPRLIEVPCVYLLPRAGETLSETEVLDWAKPRLAGFKMPKFVVIVEDFESIGMTASSKIQKRHLVEHAIKKFGLKTEETA